MPPDTMTTATTVKSILAELESLGDERVRAHNRKDGAGDAQFGVKLGDVRKVAAKVKGERELVDALWKTKKLEPRLVAILLVKPKDLARDDVDRMVRSAGFVQVADWLMAYVVKKHAAKEPLREAWMADVDPWASRAGWALTAERVEKSSGGLDLGGLLDRIEREMPASDPLVQWTMNACLAAIGIQSPQHRKRAVAIGEAIGAYRDYPVSKGCTSPFAPIWIAEMVRRQG
jgi:3-methyladenine DNA glycosylase AlkD